MVMGLALVGAILLGVMASISTAFMGQRDSTARTESHFLLGRVLEEIQASPYDTLLSFNGTSVTEGDHRAAIRVAPVGPDLLEVQVDVVSTSSPDVTSSGVLLVAQRD